MSALDYLSVLSSRRVLIGGWVSWYRVLLDCICLYRRRAGERCLAAARLLCRLSCRFCGACCRCGGWRSRFAWWRSRRWRIRQVIRRWHPGSCWPRHCLSRWSLPGLCGGGFHLHPSPVGHCMKRLGCFGLMLPCPEWQIEQLALALRMARLYGYELLPRNADFLHGIQKPISNWDFKAMAWTDFESASKPTHVTICSSWSRALATHFHNVWKFNQNKHFQVRCRFRYSRLTSFVLLGFASSGGRSALPLLTSRSDRSFLLYALRWWCWPNSNFHHFHGVLGSFRSFLDFEPTSHCLCQISWRQSGLGFAAPLKWLWLPLGLLLVVPLAPRRRHPHWTSSIRRLKASYSKISWASPSSSSYTRVHRQPLRHP